MSFAQLDTFASATEMLAGLRARKISAVELLEMHLAQIARFNPRLNAIITPNYENAREMALAADKARAEDSNTPLLGLPVTVKDSISVAGLRSTMGVAEFAHHVPEHEALVVSRIRQAGAVILGKTNIPPWADDWQTDNAVFGRTLNPWNFDFTPGGSTGGGAAAVAAGFTPLETGSDMAGSIRVPAAFCGIYGHKTSETALPRTGGNPWSVHPNPAHVFVVQGPLACSAADLEIALDVSVGADRGEDMAWQVRIPPARFDRLRDARIAVLRSISWLPVEPEIIRALQTVVEKLSGHGVTVKELHLPFAGDLRDYYKLYLSLLNARYSVGMDRESLQKSIAELRAKQDEFADAESDGYAAQRCRFYCLAG